MKIKICGMKYPDNLKEISALMPDYLGFIFYKKSPRYMKNTLKPESLQEIPSKIKKVGVFVNESVKEMQSTALAYDLDYLQLHGDESLETVIQLKKSGLKVIKAFRIKNQIPMESIRNFAPHVDAFLFDAAGEGFGGNGIEIDRDILEKDKLEWPVFLAGGIGPDSKVDLLQLKSLGITSLDANSKLETAPGQKSLALCSQFITQIRNFRNAKI